MQKLEEQQKQTATVCGDDKRQASEAVCVLCCFYARVAAYQQQTGIQTYLYTDIYIYKDAHTHTKELEWMSSSDLTKNKIIVDFQN